MGWNGRNYYNYQNTNAVSSGVSADGNGWININTTSDVIYCNYFTNNLDVLENTYYNVIIEIKKAENCSGRFFITSAHNPTNQFNDWYIDNSNIIQGTYINSIRILTGTDKNQGLRTFYHNKNRNNNEILTFRISVLDVDDSITEDNFEYEPYYITPSTTVVQQQNHTLKAIWQAN